MAKKLYYDSSLIRIRSANDGYKHLAVSVIQFAMTDADRGDEKAKDWLFDQGLVWAEFAGGNKEAVREELSRRYAAIDSD